MSPKDPLSETSARKWLSRQSEDELLAAAARVFRTGFPNPGRSGCPSPEVLRAVTQKRHDRAESEIVFEHLTCCSPCFMEYETLLRREKLSKNFRVLTLCASLLVTVAVAIWFYGQRGQEGIRPPESMIARQPPRPQPPSPIQYEVAIVDLRNRALVRGEQHPIEEEPVVGSIQARPLELSVFLPVGSEESRYDLQFLRSAESPLLTATGSAALENRNVVLRVRTDLSGLAPGRYVLGIRKANFQWAYYPITLVPRRSP